MATGATQGLHAYTFLSDPETAPRRLMEAIQNRDMHMFKYVLERTDVNRPIQVNMSAVNERLFRIGVVTLTPLAAVLIKIELGDEIRTEMIRMLVEAKANANIPCAETPLTYAVSQGQVELTRLLLESKASPFPTISEGFDPLNDVICPNGREAFRLCQDCVRERMRPLLHIALSSVLTRDPSAIVIAYLINPKPSPIRSMTG